MVKGSENDALRELMVFLEKSAKKNKAPIWIDVARGLAAPKRRKVAVNLAKLEKVTKAKDIVVVPGKLLGSGELKHALTVASWNASAGVREKIGKCGGRLLTLKELVESNPSGKGVMLLK